MIAYALAWVMFGAAHSLMAREGPKLWLKRRAGRWMRLLWNAVALAQLALVLWVGHRAMPHPAPFARPPWLVGAQVLAGGLGLAVLCWSSVSYDMGRFLGTAQVRAAGADDDEPFAATGPLRWVRHPLYLGSILTLCALVSDTRGLATLGCATAYILVGMRFEEAALLRRFGPVYATWRRRVPALLPWRGRAWPG